MDNLGGIYEAIMGVKPTSEADPEIRHTSLYLCELLSKEYGEILSISKGLHKEHQKLMTEMYQSVVECVPVALQNIRLLADVSESIGDVSKIITDIASVSKRCDNITKESIRPINDIIKDLTPVDETESEKFPIEILVDLHDGILKDEGADQISMITAYDDLLSDIASAEESRMVKTIKQRVEQLKRREELKLFEVLGSNINVATKIISDIRRLGLSTEEEISIEFIRNKSRYMASCLKIIEKIAEEDVDRALREASATLKTKVNSVVLCYKNSFGDVDIYLGTLINQTLMQFFTLFKRLLKDTESPRAAQLAGELQEISDLFGSYGLAFDPLLGKIFKK